MGCDIPDNYYIIVAQYSKCSTSITNHTEELLYVFPYQNSKLLSCSSTSYKILNLETKSEEATVKFKKKVFSLFFIENTLKLFCGYESGEIEILDLLTKKRNQLIAHEVPVTSMLLLQNGFFVSADSEGLVIIWNLKILDEVNSFKYNSSAITYLLQLNDQRLLSIGKDGRIKVYKKRSYIIDLSWLACNANCLIQLKDHRLIYNSKQDLIVSTIELITMHLKSKHKILPPKPQMVIPNAHDSFITYLLYLRCKTEFASASNDQTIKLWETSNLTCKQILEGHTGAINYLFERIVINKTKKTKKTQTEEGNKNIETSNIENTIKEETSLLSCGSDNCVKIWIK